MRMSSLRRSVARFLAVAAIASALVPIAGATAPAFAASCAPETDTAFTGNNSQVWLGTSEYSIWTAGPAHISYTLSGSFSLTSTVSIDITVGVSDIVSKAEAKFGYSLAVTQSWSKSWTYTLDVPKNVTQRVRIYHKGWAVGVKTYRVYSDCSVHTIATGNLHSPISSNDNAYFCIVRETQGNVKNVMSSCSNH